MYMYGYTHSRSHSLESRASSEVPPNPETRNHALETGSWKPETRIPKPEPKPETRNWEYDTRNLKPETQVGGGGGFHSRTTSARSHESRTQTRNPKTETGNSKLHTLGIQPRVG